MPSRSRTRLTRVRRQATHDLSDALISVGCRNPFEEFAGPLHFVGSGLYTPACPVSLVLSAVQEIFAGIAGRLTSHSFAAGGDFTKSKEVPDFLWDFNPRTGILLRWRQLWLGVRGISPRHEVQKASNRMTKRVDEVGFVAQALLRSNFICLAARGPLLVVVARGAAQTKK
jgi:hypothetical protein